MYVQAIRNVYNFTFYTDRIIKVSINVHRNECKYMYKHIIHDITYTQTSVHACMCVYIFTLRSPNVAQFYTTGAKSAHDIDIH